MLLIKIALIGVHAVGDADSSMDCDYAALDFDESAARLTCLCRKARNIQITMEPIHALKGIEVWDSTPIILSRHEALELAGAEKVEQCDNSRRAVTLDVESSKWDRACNQSERIEAVVLHASSHAVYWDFFPKYTTVCCETDDLSSTLLTRHTGQYQL
jgi:hypothetical protein